MTAKLTPSEILKDLQLSSFNAGRLGHDYKYGTNRKQALKQLEVYYGAEMLKMAEIKEIAEYDEVLHRRIVKAIRERFNC